MVKVIENENLGEALASPFALIDFSATWCGPCRMLAPVIEELSDELDGKVEFFNVDVDENPTLAQQFMVRSIPSIALVKNGEVVDTTVGFMPKDALREFITSKM